MQQPKPFGFSPNIQSARNNSEKKSGVIRIIGGDWRGRKLRFSSHQGLRPSLDRTRETLFNWLSPYIHDTSCLDLFAGSGALGFEAISRGASNVVMVEKNKKVVADLKANCELLNADNIHIVHSDASKFLSYNQDKFDLVFLDPPFGYNLVSSILKSLETHLNNEALIYIEQEKNIEEPRLEQAHWEILKSKKTPAFLYQLYRYNFIS